MKTPKAPAETPEQIAARKKEEARIAASEARAQSDEIAALKRDRLRRSETVRARFGARNAMSPFGGVGSAAPAGGQYAPASNALIPGTAFNALAAQFSPGYWG